MDQIDFDAAMRSTQLDCNNNHPTKSEDSNKLTFGVDSILNRVPSIASGNHSSAFHTLQSLLDLRSTPAWPTSSTAYDLPYSTSSLASLSVRDKANKCIKESSSQQAAASGTSESNQALHESHLPLGALFGSHYPSTSTAASTYYGTSNWFYDSAFLNHLAIKKLSNEPYSNMPITTPFNVYESQPTSEPNQIDASYLNYYRQIFPNYVMNYWGGTNLLVAKETNYNSITATPQANTNSQVPDKKKRTWSRAVFSNLQRRGLEKRFAVSKYITKPDRRQLAATLGLTDAQVKVWFQNRRMKWRHSLDFPKLIILQNLANKTNEWTVASNNPLKTAPKTSKSINGSKPDSKAIRTNNNKS